MSQRVLVCGGRDYDDRAVLDATLSRLVGVSVIIEGGARGADRMAAQWARANRIRHDRYLADWAKHGRAAGAIRNQEMLVDGKPDLVVAFPGGRGTADMVRRARSAGVTVMHVVHVGEEASA